MPTLDWIGKSKVVNHHLDVPYCVLDRKLTGYQQARTSWLCGWCPLTPF